mgnify:CR=1 FL=1
MYYGEPSRHHNKIQKDSTFDGQKYDKILTPNRLSEFIINVETGEFVTEWDVLKTKDTQTVMSKGSSYKKEKESFLKKRWWIRNLSIMLRRIMWRRIRCLMYCQHRLLRRKSFIWKMI